MWDVFSLPDPCNKDKQMRSSSKSVYIYLGIREKPHKSLQKDSKAYQYVVQNLT